MLTKDQQKQKEKYEALAHGLGIPKHKCCSVCAVFHVQLFICFTCKDRFCLEHRDENANCEKCRDKVGVKRPNRSDRRKMEKRLRALGVKKKVIR